MELKVDPGPDLTCHTWAGEGIAKGSKPIGEGGRLTASDPPEKWIQQIAEFMKSLSDIKFAQESQALTYIGAGKQDARISARGTQTRKSLLWCFSRFLVLTALMVKPRQTESCPSFPYPVYSSRNSDGNPKHGLMCLDHKGDLAQSKSRICSRHPLSTRSLVLLIGKSMQQDVFESDTPIYVFQENNRCCDSLSPRMKLVRLCRTSQMT